MLDAGSFFGEQYLAGQTVRIASAIAQTQSSLARTEKAQMITVLSEEWEFSYFFLSHLLSRTARYEEDLIDQLFNSSEKRLARILFCWRILGQGNPPVLANIGQETLAEMIGTTRASQLFYE